MRLERTAGLVPFMAAGGDGGELLSGEEASAAAAAAAAGRTTAGLDAVHAKRWTAKRRGPRGRGEEQRPTAAASLRGSSGESGRNKGVARLQQVRAAGRIHDERDERSSRTGPSTPGGSWASAALRAALLSG